MERQDPAFTRRHQQAQVQGSELGLFTAKLTLPPWLNTELKKASTDSLRDQLLISGRGIRWKLRAAKKVSGNLPEQRSREQHCFDSS